MIFLRERIFSVGSTPITVAAATTRPWLSLLSLEPVRFHFNSSCACQSAQPQPQSATEPLPLVAASSFNPPRSPSPTPLCVRLNEPFLPATAVGFAGAM